MQASGSVNNIDLKGRRAIVTGAAQGIGLSVARRLLDSGAAVSLWDRDAELLEQTHAEIAGAGDLHRAIVELTDAQAVARAADEAAATLGGIDILVNNAGTAWGMPFEEFSEQGWDKVMDLNLKSPFFLLQALHSSLIAGASPSQPAKVINITSIDGQRLNPWETYSYHASKSALIYLTKRLAARLVGDHINVTSIAPGAFPSEMNRAARDHAAEVAASIPSGRVGVAEDMAGAAIYLASRAGDYVVGDTITVDGGLVHASLGSSIDA